MPKNAVALLVRLQTRVTLQIPKCLNLGLYFHDNNDGDDYNDNIKKDIRQRQGSLCLYIYIYIYIKLANKMQNASLRHFWIETANSLLSQKQ